jgi:antirestriction protein ArdC
VSASTAKKTLKSIDKVLWVVVSICDGKACRRAERRVLCADLQITDEPHPDPAQYLDSWLSVIKEDKKAIFTAASMASEAAAYLTGLQS